MSLSKSSRPGIARFRPQVEALGDRTLLSVLPTPWQDADIGGPPLAGSASVSDGTFNVTGAGRDIGGPADQFNFLSRNLTGDGMVSAHVATLTATNGLTEAGVMSRDGIAADAPFVAVLTTPAGGVHLQWRSAVGATAGQADVTGINGPVWVKIDRSGGTFRGLYSTDKKVWTQVGPAVTAAMSDTVRVGLAVASHDSAALSTATADTVRVVGRPATPTGLTATAGNGQVTLNWNPTPGAVRYNVYLGTSSGGEQLVATGLTSPTYTATGLTNGKMYYARVAGTNAAGEGTLSLEVSVKPTASAYNTPVPTAYAGTGLVTLSWPTVPSAIYYTVYRGTISGGEVKIGTALYDSNQPDSITYRDTAVTNGTKYFYRVEATFYTIQPLRSAEVSATPLALADWLGHGITDLGLRALAQKDLTDGKLDRSDLIGLLRNAQTDGGATPISADEFRDLEKILYNAAALKIPAPTLNLADKLINGSPANAHYQGQALGNLSVGTTSVQLDELIGKWFYGTDHPELPAAKNSQYITADPSWTLFGADGQPEYTDVGQGHIGDCYYMTSLADLAYTSPQAIKDMFTDNGDGTYTVRFYHDGVADYVTVDRMLCNTVADYNRNDGEIWVNLAEKAYAQLAEEGWSYDFGQTNSFRTIGGGGYCAFDQLTGQPVGDLCLEDTDQAVLNNLLATHQLVYLANEFKESGLKVLNHAYSILSFDPNTQLYTLYNPWGFHEYATFEQIRAAFYGYIWIGDTAGAQSAPPQSQTDVGAADWTLLPSVTTPDVRHGKPTQATGTV